jgi:hypothetical protein
VEVELMATSAVRRTRNLADAWVRVAPIAVDKPEHAIDCAGCGPVGVGKTGISALGAAARHAARCNVAAPQT